MPADGGPNQIANVEDGRVLPDNVQAEEAHESAFFRAETHMQQPRTPPVDQPRDGSDVIMFTPIEPKRTKEQLERMKSRRTKSKERAPQQ